MIKQSTTHNNSKYEYLNYETAKQYLRGQKELKQQFTCGNCDQLASYCMCEANPTLPAIVRTPSQHIKLVDRNNSDVQSSKSMTRKATINQNLNSKIDMARAQQGITNYATTLKKDQYQGSKSMTREKVLKEYEVGVEKGKETVKEYVTSEVKNEKVQMTQPVIHKYITPIIEKKIVHEIHRYIDHKKEKLIEKEEVRDIKHEEKKLIKDGTKVEVIKHEEYRKPKYVEEEQLKPILKKEKSDKQVIIENNGDLRRSAIKQVGVVDAASIEQPLNESNIIQKRSSSSLKGAILPNNEKRSRNNSASSSSSSSSSSSEGKISDKKSSKGLIKEEYKYSATERKNVGVKLSQSPQSKTAVKQQVFSRERYSGAPYGANSNLMFRQHQQQQQYQGQNFNPRSQTINYKYPNQYQNTNFNFYQQNGNSRPTYNNGQSNGYNTKQQLFK